MMIQEDKEDIYLYGREVCDMSKEEAEKFADFAIGFHESFTLEDRYVSFKMATQGPEQTSMEDQSKEFNK